MSGVLLTAGYDRAWHSVYVAERLRRAGHAPALIVIAYPMTFARARTILRSRGGASVMRYLLRRGGPALASPVEAAARADGVPDASLRGWARRHGVRVHRTGDLNASATVREIAALAPDVTAYTGGGILRRAFLEAAGRRVLNAHSGPLPAIRGMNAMEWSLLLRQPTGITLHLIDEGIDTGSQLEWVAVPPVASDSLDTLRGRMIQAGAEAMVRGVLRALDCGLHPAAAEGAPQRQCFVLAPALRELAVRRLAEIAPRACGGPAA